MAGSRLYVDTSVFGGPFDPEFAVESRRFFDLVHARLVVVLVSQVVVDEIAGAPGEVQEHFRSLPAASIEPVSVTPEVVALREAYIGDGIVSRKHVDDATHVAAATVARAHAVVSWNFRHLVRLDKMRAYNQTNLRMGFGLISIVSPQEVWIDEEA